RGSLGEAEGEVAGDEITVRQPSDPVRAEQSGHEPSACLALRELRGLAGLLETGLLALDDAGVTSEEAGLLERGAVVLAVDLVGRAGDRETQRTGLAGGAASGDAGDHVVRADEVEQLERVGDELLVQLAREVLLELTAVHGERAGAGDEAHAGD